MNMFNRLFANPKPSSDTIELSVQSAQKVVQQYCSFLESSAPLPGCVADSTQLPHCKDTIKEAIATCITAISDPVLTEHLRHGYLMLAAWQDGVGDRTLGLDFTQLNLDQDPMALAELIQQQSNRMENWNTRVEADQVSLMSELRLMGAYAKQTGT
ncbi:MAG: hypothetical protein V7746_24030 [Halioglobus sp.]